MAEKDNVVEELQVLETKKRKRNQPNLLISYSKLLTDDVKVRAKHGGIIIGHLVRSNSVDKGEESLDYALKRVVRGLGASSNVSRAGFYSVLATLLKTPSVNVTAEEVLDVLEKELHTSGHNSKSENADILTGHVLVCGSLLRSGLFKTAKPESRTKIVELLVNASNKKSYLSLPAYVFIIDSLDSLSPEEFEQMMSVMKTELKKPLTDYTLDNLYFLLQAREKFPGYVNEKFLKKTIGHKEVISKDTVLIIADLLMCVLPIPQILKHPVYETTCKKMATSPFVRQFIAKIDDVLSRPTIMRHQVATLILTKLVQNLADLSLLPEFFTGNFLQETLTHFKTVSSKNQDELQLAIYKLFDTTVTALKPEGVDTSVKITVIKRFMFYPGTFIFEKLTRSKVLQQITMTLSTEGVKELCAVYRGVMLAETVKQKNERATETWLNLDRVYASQLIVKLLSHTAVKGEFDWKKEQLTVIMEAGLLRMDKYCNVGSDLSGPLKDTFFNALDIRLPKLDDMRAFQSHLVHHLDSLITDDNYTTIMRNGFDEADYELWKKTIALIKKMEARLKKSHLTPVFHTLFLHMCLQMCNSPKIASDSLKELFSCYEHTKKKNKQIEDDDGNISWIEVVIDLFLNLLSHNSRLFRNVIGCVFPHLCKDLTANAIHQILSVLDPKTDDNPLSEKGDSDSETESDNDKESSDDEESEDDSESGDVVESENEEETVNDKLRQAVTEALGAAHSDDESVDLDQLSDSECDKLNDALGEAFKRFKPNVGKKSRKQNRDEETLTHFRVRVLDLIDIYLDSPDVSMIYCLEIMLPLLQTLEFSIKDNHQKPLQDRVRHCLRKLVNIKKFGSIEDVDRKVLCNLLASLLDKGTKTTLIIQVIGDKISECCIFIIRCIQNLEGAETTSEKSKKKLRSSVTKILLASLESFFKKRDCLTPYHLFKNLLNIVWDGIVVLVPQLVDYAFDEDIRPFRRNQAFELLKVFYSNNRVLNVHADVFIEHLRLAEMQLQAYTIHFLGNPKATTKEKPVCSLFTLLTILKRSPIKTNSIDWVAIGRTIKEYRSCITMSRNAKMSYNKLCGALKIPPVVEMKGELLKMSAVHEDKDAEDVNAKIEKKPKKRKQQKKLRKETQMLRMESLSEGLMSTVSFNYADVEAMQEVEVDDESGDEMETVQNGTNGMHTGDSDVSSDAGKRKSDSGDAPKKKKHRIK